MKTNTELKFLVDAQLPSKLNKLISNLGYDTIHTDNLPDRDKTTDNQIRNIAQLQNRVVITKDSDFLDSFLY